MKAVSGSSFGVGLDLPLSLDENTDFSELLLPSLDSRSLVWPLALVLDDLLLEDIEDGIEEGFGLERESFGEFLEEVGKEEVETDFWFCRICC